MSLLQMYNVSKHYETVEVLKEISLQIDRGDFVCLTGRTGSGKSTLMKLIYMEERPTSGQVIVEGYSSDQIKRREIPLLRRKIGVLFQDFKLLRERTAYENVSFALHVTGRPQREVRKSVVRALTKVGLGHKRDSFPHELSGGEQQRVALARALVNEPILLLADEPTGNLDMEVGQGIVDLFQQVNYQGTAILMATHNLPLMENLQTRRIHLADGRLTGETGGEIS
ncbi:cell division ATP-binding protein FtsE [Gemmatimonadota bacterium]